MQNTAPHGKKQQSTEHTVLPSNLNRHAVTYPVRSELVVVVVVVVVAVEAAALFALKMDAP
jgi:hypothetical protein